MHTRRSSLSWGIKHLDEVPGQIHVVNGSPHIATIYVTGPDDRRINDLIFTLCEDGRYTKIPQHFSITRENDDFFKEK